MEAHREPQSEDWHSRSPDGKWLATELFDTDEAQFHIGLMDWEPVHCGGMEKE